MLHAFQIPFHGMGGCLSLYTYGKCVDRVTRLAVYKRAKTCVIAMPSAIGLLFLLLKTVVRVV